MRIRGQSPFPGYPAAESFNTDNEAPDTLQAISLQSTTFYLSRPAHTQESSLRSLLEDNMFEMEAIR